MEKQLFADVPFHQRAEMLEANAEKVEEMTYQRPLSPEELEKERINFSQISIEVSTTEDKLKAIQDEYKATLKPMKENARQTLTMIKTKHREVKETVYHLADHEAGMMCTYNKIRELIMSRRLTPEENQLSIHLGRTMKAAINQ